MNAIWTCMVLVSMIVLLVIAPKSALTTLIDSSTSSLMLCINLCAVYAVWLGLMEIVHLSGLADKLAKRMSPLIRKILRVKDEETTKHISINLSANILGLGNAATPSGMRAMQRMDDGSGRASFFVIMLFVINTTSIQLLPTTIMGLRAAAGSQSAGDIILPTIITSIVTTLLGVSLVLLIDKLKRRKK